MFNIGDLVREGGPLGPISKIIDIRDNIFVVQSLDGMSTGYMTKDQLRPYKVKPNFEQLKLF